MLCCGDRVVRCCFGDGMEFHFQVLEGLFVFISSLLSFWFSLDFLIVCFDFSVIIDSFPFLFGELLLFLMS